jgi:hypothetical protein
VPDPAEGFKGNPVKIGSGPAAVSPAESGLVFGHWKQLPGRPRPGGKPEDLVMVISSKPVNGFLTRFGVLTTNRVSLE